MIVPLELSVLGHRKGYVSPELALGWRVGGHARDVFSDFNCLHIASSRMDDSTFALSEMVGRQSVFSDVEVVAGSRPWDFLCYHPQTSTTLAYSAIAESTKLPKAIADLEARLPTKDTSVLNAYQHAVDCLILTIVTAPFERLCVIRECRVRRLVREPVKRRQYCPRCSSPLSDGALWDMEGVVCCSSCCGLESSWTTFH